MSSSMNPSGRPNRAGKKAPRVRFLCSDCGDDFPQWYGQCPSCRAWNTLKEFRPPIDPADAGRSPSGSLLGRGRPTRPTGFFAGATAARRGEPLLPGTGTGEAGDAPRGPGPESHRHGPAPSAAGDRSTAVPGPEDTVPSAGVGTPDTRPDPSARDARSARDDRSDPSARDTRPDPSARDARSDPSAPDTRPDPSDPGTRSDPAAPGPRSGPAARDTRPGPVTRDARSAPAGGSTPAARDAGSLPAPPAVPSADRAPGSEAELPTLLRIRDVPLASAPRLRTGIQELDRILGGGLVAGSAVLLGGDPGIGKSTLLLQAAGRLVRNGVRVLYVSGEESAGQIRLRAERLSDVPPDLILHTETNLEEVDRAIDAIQPDVVVVDSIQTAFLPAVASAPGSVTQVRESALALIGLAKARGMALLLVGHVTKEGAIAGPKTLEHMVDTVLYMEGERYQHYRILRSVKNRFGSVDELGVFEMAAGGLLEVPNPSQVFLSEHTAGAVGSIVATSVEGTRALLLEVQALVNNSQYSNPQRVATGYDPRRLDLLLAVLEKRTGLQTSKKDVFVNIAGGLRVLEPGVDLGVLLAVASSLLEAAPDPAIVVMGEVGLGGEIRRIAHPERRIQEVARLGYRKALLPLSNARDLGAEREGVRIHGAEAVVQALEIGLQRRVEVGGRSPSTGEAR